MLASCLALDNGTRTLSRLPFAIVIPPQIKSEEKDAKMDFLLRVCADVRMCRIFCF